MAEHKIQIDCSRCHDIIRCLADGCQYLAKLEPPPPKAMLHNGWLCPGCQTVHCPTTLFCNCLKAPVDERVEHRVQAATLGELMRMTRGVTEADFPTRREEKK